MTRNLNRVRLTAGRVSAFTCTPEKSQAFLWDTEVPALMLRATPTGRKTYAFESRLFGKTLRIGLGSVEAWTLEQAREQARRYAVLVDRGQDPRELERRQKAEQEALRQQARAKAVTVGDVWPLYLENGRPKRKEAWKPRYLADLHAMARPGGDPKKRGAGVTRPGPLYPLLGLPLSGVTEDILKSWFDKEARAGRHQAARALMMFRGFLRWCSSQPEYRSFIDRGVGAAPAILENLPANTRRTDKLMAEQIGGWWRAVERLHNPVHSVYLRALLLTGARRNEIASMRWDGIDWRWKTLTIADKAEETRTIPLGPVLAQLLGSLPRTNAYVFAAKSSTGYVQDVRASMAKVLAECSIPHLTFHGLRRTFTQTARRIVPAGVPAQISGHKESAVAEGYNILELDELRPYVAQIEMEFLRLAGVQFDAQEDPGKLRAVK